MSHFLKELSYSSPRANFCRRTWSLFVPDLNTNKTYAFQWLKKPKESYKDSNNCFCVKKKNTNCCTFVFYSENSKTILCCWNKSNSFSRLAKTSKNNFPWPYSTESLVLRRVVLQVQTLKNQNIKSCHSLHWPRQCLFFLMLCIWHTGCHAVCCHVLLSEYPSTVVSYTIHASWTVQLQWPTFYKVFLPDIWIQHFPQS